MTITRPGDVDPVASAVNRAIGEAVDGRAGARIGVACSGGADSIALAHATIAAAGSERVVVLHVDHQLQAGSEQVAEAVAAWARGQGARAQVRRVTVADRASVEAAARDARYAALAELADEHELAAVFVGHTARDQAETVLLRLLRGTGPAGLAGIPRARLLHPQRCADTVATDAASDAPQLVRPLLDVSRAAVDAYVAAHALPTWFDPMNADRTLARVRVRDEVLPALRRENPQLDQALVRLAASAGEWLAVIDALAAPLAHWPLDAVALGAQLPAVRKRALAIALEHAGVDYEAVHLDALDALLVRPASGEVGLDLPDARVVRSYDRLDLAERDPGLGTVTPLVAPAGYVLRRWQPGDRMRPARLRGRSRKLSDLFIDAKVPRALRATARVVVRDDGEIVWAEHLGLAHGEMENVAARPPE